MRALVMALVFLSAAGVTAAEPAPQLARLSWMIGTWSFDDRATPAAGFDYAEQGERSCAWTLEQRYIECLSTGRTARSTRTYRHLWTWNEEAARLELISLFGNTPSRGLAYGTISQNGRSIELRTDPETEDGVTATFRYSIRYDGERSYVWESARGLGEAPLSWTTRFVDRAERRT